jgi:hypothetical protein
LRQESKQWVKQNDFLQWKVVPPPTPFVETN